MTQTHPESAWERVPLRIPPCPTDETLEAADAALYAVCAEFWRQRKVPVVAWGCEYDGVQLLPPKLQ